MYAIWGPGPINNNPSILLTLYIFVLSGDTHLRFRRQAGDLRLRLKCFPGLPGTVVHRETSQALSGLQVGISKGFQGILMSAYINILLGVEEE